jgi:hypothetical protein
MLESSCPLGSSLGDGGAPTLLKNLSSQLLEWCAVKDVEFIQCNMTGDKSWFDHFHPEIKQQNGMASHIIQEKKARNGALSLYNHGNCHLGF